MNTTKFWLARLATLHVAAHFLSSATDPIQKYPKHNSSTDAVRDAPGPTMSRFLRRAAIAAALGGILYAAAATGHLALVRAHPELRDLNALLTPRSFLIDATQAFLAAALRFVPSLPAELRLLRATVSSKILSAEAKGDAEAANDGRLQLAAHDARDGRLEDALAAFAQQPNDPVSPLMAAVLCHMLGRSEEEARWVRLVPSLSDPVVKEAFQKLQALAVLKATLGCAPRAAGSDKLVLGTMLGLVEMSMWSIFNDGGLTERLQVLAFMLFLRRLVAMDLGNSAADRSQDTTPSS